MLLSASPAFLRFGMLTRPLRLHLGLLALAAVGFLRRGNAGALRRLLRQRAHRSHSDCAKPEANRAHSRAVLKVNVVVR